MNTPGPQSEVLLSVEPMQGQGRRSRNPAFCRHGGESTFALTRGAIRLRDKPSPWNLHVQTHLGRAGQTPALNMSVVSVSRPEQKLACVPRETSACTRLGSHPASSRTKCVWLRAWGGGGGKGGDPFLEDAAEGAECASFYSVTATFAVVS